MSAHDAAMAELAKGAQLKHVEVNDKSAPVIDSTSLSFVVEIETCLLLEEFRSWPL